MTSKDTMSSNRPISLSYAQSENQIKQYRLEQQLFDQKAAMEFLQTMLSLSIPIEEPHSALKDGVLLCQLLNQIKPGTVKQISKSPTPFSKMSNVYNFLNGATKLGLEDADLFETVDLYEGKDMAKVYLTILAVARKLCNISFPKRSSSDREKNPLTRVGPISDEKIFNANLSNDPLFFPQDKTQSEPKLIRTNSNTNTVVAPEPPNIFSPPISNVFYSKSPLSQKIVLDNSTNDKMYFNSPEMNKIQPSMFSMNFPSRTPSRRPVSQYISLDYSVTKINSDLSKTSFSPPLASEKIVSDKIKNLRLFFDSEDKQVPSPNLNASKIIKQRLSLVTEKDKTSSSTEIIKGPYMRPSLSAPVKSTVESPKKMHSSVDLSHDSEEYSSSFTRIEGSFSNTDSINYDTNSTKHGPTTNRVPTAEDRVKKPTHYRVGKGGIIEDLDLSIKKNPTEHSRGDLLRLDNIDWGVDSEDSGDESEHVFEETSPQLESMSLDTSFSSQKFELTVSPVSQPELPLSNFDTGSSSSQVNKIKKEHLALRKQHSRNYSEKPIPSQMDSLPMPRPRAGSAGPGDYAKDRLSLFFENSKLLAHYQLGDCIGKGQFGSVFKALNLHTGQIVAVKRIELDGRAKEETESLMGEVDLLKSLTHVRIVHYEGYVQSELYLNIILEYVENGSLLSLLRSYGVFSETLVASYTSQILEGLVYLHNQQVVHCDLKAANILTTKNGEVKLTDFGVSLNLKINDSDIGEIAAGTPYWMAPEVITLQGASTASDIWSLACTIVELLTGKPPYHDLNKHAALYRIVEEECPPIPENISKNLENFLLLSFNKKPTKRPTADQLTCHEWIIESQLNNEVTSKLKVSSQESVFEEEQRESQITDSLWESCYSFSEDSLLSPPPMSTSIRLPEQQIGSSSDHNFIRSTFARPIICRVCHEYAKRQAMMCHDCKMICHIKCAENANLACIFEGESSRQNLTKRFPALRAPASSQNIGRRTFYSEGAISNSSHVNMPHTTASSSSAIPLTAKQKVLQRKKKHNDDCCIS